MEPVIITQKNETPDFIATHDTPAPKIGADGMPNYMADPSFVKPVIASKTVRWIAIAGVLYAVRTMGIPMIPEELHTEIVDGIIYILNAVIPLVLVEAARSRIRAREVISGWMKS